ncbi:MAG TPA: extracellular solute-binding protein, partial [Mycobacterium sp.]|nr:extracellular solute-binding protein [Mycobacterium sp.]
RVEVCAPPGFCASDLRHIEDKAGVQLPAATAVATTRDVLNDVVTGKADAGLVYTTDALDAGDNISWFEFPEAADAGATYSIALLKQSDQVQSASMFIELVTGNSGQQILRQAGFTKP